jgi:anti-anti-sigma factor
VVRAVASTNRTKARPRFVDRKRKCMSWDCPARSVFSILVVFEPHDVLLQLTGELDLASIRSFEDCVAWALREHPRRLVLELSGLDFGDVSALRGFLGAKALAASAGGELVLAGPQRQLLELLAVAGLEREFRIWRL